jgi:hypothetical protein
MCTAGIVLCSSASFMLLLFIETRFAPLPDDSEIAVV